MIDRRFWHGHAGRVVKRMRLSPWLKGAALALGLALLALGVHARSGTSAPRVDGKAVDASSPLPLPCRPGTLPDEEVCLPLPGAQAPSSVQAP